MFFLFLMVSCSNPYSFSQTIRDKDVGKDEELKATIIEGRMVKALSIGTRYADVTVKLANGELFYCSVPCVLDFADHAKIPKLKELWKNVENEHSLKQPAISDLGSIVRVYYVKLSTCNFLLGIEVLEEIKPRFIIIASRTEVIDKPLDITRRFRDMVGHFFENGFDYGVINVEDFPRANPEFPEYYVVFAGVFCSYKEAVNCLNVLTESGWRYAYVKEVR